VTQFAPEQTQESALIRALPTCTHNGTRPPCWYCALPSWMFEDAGRMKKRYQGYAKPWSGPRHWLHNVANVRDEGILQALQDRDPRLVYCGRANVRFGLTESRWHNPFRIGPDGTRDEVIGKFEEYLMADEALMEMLPSLRGKILVCWCKPESCHCEVLTHWAHQRSQERN
jgi:hypothetical protein